MNLNIKQKVKNYPFSLSRLKTAAQMYTRGNYSSTKSTALLYPPFQEVLNDERSMKVFKKNTLEVDPEIQNEFSRNKAWNETLNCPYYGLVSLRRTAEQPINSTIKEQNILQPFTLGTNAGRINIRKVKSAIKRRNELREMDSKIYNLI